jgi:RNA polymerase sigma-70 factor (ECF subfamily)
MQHALLLGSLSFPVLSDRHPTRIVSVDEAALLAAARRSDESAWRTLVDRHEGAVAAVVIGMLGPGDEADDVGQETFIRFFRSLGSFRGESSVKTWLQRIAINLSLNALKRRKRGLRRFLDLDDADEATPQLQSSDIAAHDARTTIEMVRAAVTRLPEKQRPVVVLRMIEGYSTRETADILGIPEGTVLSRLARAMDHLRQQLGQQRGDNA